MTRKHLVNTAKLEMAEWVGLPNGLVLAILFCFIHRAVEGESVEKTFRMEETVATDYEI